MDHTRPEGYAFDEYLAALGENWLDDDALLLRWLARAGIDDATLEWLRGFGRTTATRYRDWADVVERRENLPVVALHGPYNRASGEVVLPPEARQMLAEVHGSGLWKSSCDERARYALVYLLSQNGESGIACSVACTDGPRYGEATLTSQIREAQMAAIDPDTSVGSLVTERPSRSKVLDALRPGDLIRVELSCGPDASLTHGCARTRRPRVTTYDPQPTY